MPGSWHLEFEFDLDLDLSFLLINVDKISVIGEEVASVNLNDIEGNVCDGAHYFVKLASARLTSV